MSEGAQCAPPACMLPTRCRCRPCRSRSESCDRHQMRNREGAGCDGRRPTGQVHLSCDEHLSEGWGPPLRQVAPVEGKTANTPRLGPVSTSRQRIAELARQALGMAVAIAWLPGPAGTRRRVAKPSVEEPDAAEPARPDLWGARVSNDPGLPDRPPPPAGGPSGARRGPLRGDASFRRIVQVKHVRRWTRCVHVNAGQ